MRGILRTLLLCTLLAASALAQAASGSLSGRVVDDEGAPLPGVTITLGCDCDDCDNREKCDCCPDERSKRVAVTDAEGAFRFPGLAPGKYSVEATLAGFSTVKYGNVMVSVGTSATIEIRMTIAVEVSRRDRRM